MITDTKNNAPILRFPEFSGEWEEKKFGEIYSFRSTNSFSRENLNYKRGNVKNIHYGDIHTKFSTAFKVEQEEVPYIGPNVDISKIPSSNYCQKGDLIIADASEDYDGVGATIEIVELGKQPVLAGLHTILARPDLLPMSSGFGGYMMQTPQIRNQIRVIAQGIKVLSLSAKQLSATHTFRPSLPEQNKIATFLSAVDARIGLLKKKKEQLEAYKQGAMQQLFSRQIRFKDSSEKDYPDWEKTRLGKIGKFVSGVGFPEKEQNGKLGTPFLKVSDMNLAGNEHFMTSANHYVTDTQIERYKYKVIKHNAIIFAKVGAAIFQERKRIAHNFLIDNNMMAFIPNVNIMFAKQLFETITLSRYAQVGALPSYNASDLSIFKVEVPCPEEQQKIADFLSAIDKKIELCEKQIADTEKFKKGLLQQMFV